MKFKAAKKEIRDRNNIIIGIGYCNAQFLLSYTEPFAYSAGVNGWSCDYYKVNGVCISTGYNYLNKNVKYDYDLLRQYNEKAREIRFNHSIPYEEQQEQVNQLLNDFVNEVTK